LELYLNVCKCRRKKKRGKSRRNSCDMIRSWRHCFNAFQNSSSHAMRTFLTRFENLLIICHTRRNLSSRIRRS
jgi:hypothetical protein